MWIYKDWPYWQCGCWAQMHGALQRTMSSLGVIFPCDRRTPVPCQDGSGHGLGSLKVSVFVGGLRAASPGPKPGMEEADAWLPVDWP